MIQYEVVQQPQQVQYAEQRSYSPSPPPPAPADRSIDMQPREVTKEVIKEVPVPYEVIKEVTKEVRFHRTVWSNVPVLLTISRSR